MDFCRLVRLAREAKYKSAREFYISANLSCSYYYYSKVETSTVPELKLANELIEKLNLNRRNALYAWARDQMPDAEAKAFFTELSSEKSRSSEQSKVGRSLILNRMQSKLLSKDPIYFELLLFIFCHFGFQTLSLEYIAKKFAISKTKMKQMLDELYNYGLIEKADNGNYTSKEWIFIPFEPEFKAIRNINIKRAFDQFLRTAKDEKFNFRTTVTRFLTPSQQKEAEALTIALHNAIMDWPDVVGPPDATPFTIGIFGSERRFGNG